MNFTGDIDALDREDPLAGWRMRFDVPPGLIYLDGNSLGPPPRATAVRLAEVVEREWRIGLIRSWEGAGWIDLPRRLGDKLARLLGGAPGSVIVCDSTTLNVTKAVGAALELRLGRTTLLVEEAGFPTDLYAASAMAGLLGRRVRAVPSDRLAECIDEETAAVLVNHVDYRSGERQDLAGLTAAAHARGALAIWDLAHSAGVMPIELADSGADFAVGCGYKYFNGGPGAPAFLYVAPSLLGQVRFPLSGWFGHAAPFAFEPVFRPAAGIEAAQIGTPPVLAMIALEVGLDTLLDAPLDQVRGKSQRLCDIFIEAVERLCGGYSLVLATPRDSNRRGSQVSFRHAHAWPIMQALIARGVIGDMRAPDILRFGFSPLILSYRAAQDAAAILADILVRETWRAPEYQARGRVT